MLLLVGGTWRSLGVGMTPEPEDSNYRAVCAWARNNSPTDAIFLVPPQETDFRLYAERAIIVNFKHVPQLSGEIKEWNQRLSVVLGPQLAALEAAGEDYTRTMSSLSSMYESRSDDQLIAAATHYNAQFIVVTHPLQTSDVTLRYHPQSNPFFLYELNVSLPRT